MHFYNNIDKFNANCLVNSNVITELGEAYEIIKIWFEYPKLGIITARTGELWVHLQFFCNLLDLQSIEAKLVH